MSENKVSVFDAFGTKEDEEINGVWRDFYGAGGTHVRVKIARMGGNNTAFKRIMEKLSKPYRKGTVDGTPNIPPEKDAEMFREAVAKTIVKDWEGVYDHAGNDVACTVENVIMVLKRASILQDFIVQEARNVDNFAFEVNEGLAKNS